MPAVWRSNQAWMLFLVGWGMTGCGSPLVDPQGRPPSPGTSAAIRADDGRPRSPAVPSTGVRTGRVPASQLNVIDPTRRVDRYHEVQPGETLSQIAQRYGTTVTALTEGNGLDSAEIRPGQQLFVPGQGRLSGRRNLEN